MDRKASDCIVTTIGIDIGKKRFHLIGLDERGAIALRQKLSRGQVTARLVGCQAHHHNVVAAALANKLTRIAWSGRSYEGFSAELA